MSLARLIYKASGITLTEHQSKQLDAVEKLDEKTKLKVSVDPKLVHIKFNIVLKAVRFINFLMSNTTFKDVRPAVFTDKEALHYMERANVGMTILEKLIEAGVTKGGETDLKTERDLSVCSSAVDAALMQIDAYIQAEREKVSPLAHENLLYLYTYFLGDHDYFLEAHKKSDPGIYKNAPSREKCIGAIMKSIHVANIEIKPDNVEDSTTELGFRQRTDEEVIDLLYKYAAFFYIQQM